MNLKEAFRYQNFLEKVFDETVRALNNIRDAYVITNMHKRKAANPEAEDKVEIEDKANDYRIDTLIAFGGKLIEERYALSTAISKAKTGLDVDIDAITAVNKFRQTLSKSAQQVLNYKPKNKTKQGTDYRFTEQNGSQVYYYDIDITFDEDFDREKTREMHKTLVKEADRDSIAIDVALVTANVDFEPMFDVNDSFDDAVDKFLDA